MTSLDQQIAALLNLPPAAYSTDIAASAAIHKRLVQDSKSGTISLSYNNKGQWQLSTDYVGGYWLNYLTADTIPLVLCAVAIRNYTASQISSPSPT
jgi:hypothetical protein